MSLRVVYQQIRGDATGSIGEARMSDGTTIMVSGDNALDVATKLIKQTREVIAFFDKKERAGKDK